MPHLSHLALSSCYLAVIGVLVAGLILDRWYLTTEDSLTHIYGLQNYCERDYCTKWPSADGKAPCIFPGKDLQTMVTACFALYLITLALTGIAFIIAFVSSCLTSIEESFRITIFGGIIAVNLLAAFTAAGTGALFFYIVKFFMFCGDFCPFAQIRNTSIRCYSGFDTSFALWGIATVLLFSTAFFGALLKMVDRRQCNEETRALMQKQLDAEDDELVAAREHNHPEQNSDEHQPADTSSAPTNRNGNASPMKNPITAGGEETDPNTQAAKDTGAELDIPVGYVYQEDSELYWSEDDQLYYDPSSEQYYEPVSGHWYDPKSNTWYTM
jgi:hypothetical protein